MAAWASPLLGVLLGVAAIAGVALYAFWPMLHPKPQPSGAHRQGRDHSNFRGNDFGADWFLSGSSGHTGDGGTGGEADSGGDGGGGAD